MSVSLDRIPVLHVDDEPDFADLAATYLEREDERFEVETATAVDEALDRLTDDVDCIVSDYDMPGQNGIEFLETVREEYPDVPFILYTGKGSEEVASDAITAGVTEYLQKERGTGQYTVLANRIANAVRQYRSQRQLRANQKRLSLFIEQSPLGVLEYDEDFRIVGLNDAGEEILGYSESELRGETWEKIVASASYDDVDEVTSALADADGGYHSIDENVRKDGEHIVCEWHNRIVTDDEGDVVAVFSQFQDITERQRREERLERSTARLEALYENSPDMINIHDADGNIIDPNSRLCEATGYSRSELTDMTVWDLDQTLDAGESSGLWTGMETGDRTRLDGVYRRRDGSTFPVEVHVRRLNLDGEDRFMVISRDVSERVANDRELDRTNRLLSTLFETLPVGVLAEDESRNVLAVNERMFELFDLPGTPDTVVGTDCERMAEAVSDDFVDPDGFVERTNELVAEQETVHGEEWELRDGQTFARSHKPISLPAGDGHLWVYRTVTGQKEHEARLQALNETTRRLMSAESRTAVAEVGADAASRILGVDETAVYLHDDASTLAPVAVGADAETGVAALPSVSDDQRLAWRAAAGEVARAPDDPEVYSSAGAVADERYFPLDGYGVLVAGSPAADGLDPEDDVLGEILAGHVATALEQVEKADQLRRRGRELARQNERLEEFATVLSHDLRNPLNVAQGRLELAMDACDSDHLGDVADAHERMNALVDDVLALAREGNRVDDPEPVDLGAVVQDCWANVETREATVHADVEGSIRADRPRLQQLLENLVRNAVEHGGDDVAVTVGELDDADGFYVADDGPGVPEGERAEVFSPGYSTSESGTGFGLSIVKQVAEAHGWDVRATDAADGGARFEVRGVDSAH
jgi:PAS domain S-box-containing protein